ncbi:MAG TPA: CHRD domain-containing protein [Solirubrobacteraceae bacterium]|nr:CHRD domain-containing protein [Solirubrobacteraceae bacterium]
MKRTTIALTVALLAAVGIVTSVVIAAAPPPDNEQLFGALSGANEVGPDGKKNAGDPDGSGGATGTIDDQPGPNSELCVGLVFKNIGTPTASHIHRGKPSEAGPVVVGFFGPPTQTPPPPSGDPGSFSDCVTISDTLAAELLKNPSHFYWNVHTQQFPGGAIRDQVFTKKA